MAFRIVLESVWALLRHFGEALRVSALPYAALIVGAFALLVIPGGREILAGTAGGPDMRVMPFALGGVLLPLSAVVVAWVAVSWHRMVLREENAGLLPKSFARPLWPYAGQSLLIWVLTLAVVFAGVFMLGLAVALTLDLAATDRLRGILFSFGFVVFTYFWLRWGIALVGTALDKPMGMRDAWRATRSSKGTILGVSVCIVFINRIAAWLIAAFGQIPISMDVVASTTLVWLTAMLGISSLTTLYGYCVEGRH